MAPNPKADHTAQAEVDPRTWTVTRNGVEVARSDRVVVLTERYGNRDLDPVPYFPPDAVDPAILGPSDHQTRCPVKGTAHYHSITIDGERLDNAVWYYPQPTDNVSAIAGHLAFYPDRFTLEAS